MARQFPHSEKKIYAGTLAIGRMLCVMSRFLLFLLSLSLLLSSGPAATAGLDLCRGKDREIPQTSVGESACCARGCCQSQGARCCGHVSKATTCCGSKSTVDGEEDESCPCSPLHCCCVAPSFLLLSIPVAVVIAAEGTEQLVSGNELFRSRSDEPHSPPPRGASVA